jgi:hypothetical protein
MSQHQPDLSGAIHSARSWAPDQDPIHSAQVGEERLDVYLAISDTDRQQAQMLVNRMYDWRGYGSNHIIPSTDMHATFIALMDGKLVGTITLAVDSTGGLAADSLFRDEINTYRRIPTASVCELVKFAVDTELSSSRKLLASLFHIVFLYGMRHHSCTDLFIEINPRHQRFYGAMLGFMPVGEPKTNISVNAASQLMWLKVADIAALINHHAGRMGNCASARSLYTMFLNHGDERGVMSRLS